MSDEFGNLSDLEILSLIHRAQEELERRKESQREVLRSEIENRLKQAGLALGDIFPEFDGATEAAPPARKAATRQPSAAKFKNHVSGETWSGRGPHPPQWVKLVMAERNWSLQDFKASEEFLAQN
jgi:DNA-binding protein H-NS